MPNYCVDGGKTAVAFANVHTNTVAMAIESRVGDNKSLMAASHEAIAKLKKAMKTLKLQIKLADNA